MINIGYLNEKNELIIAKIIHSSYNYNLYSDKSIQQIFSQIKKEGYNFIKCYDLYGRIKKRIDGIVYEANIYTLSKNNMSITKLNNLYNSDYSEKLKTLLLLCIIQQKNYNDIFNIKKENEKVFLINKKILIKYEYYFINSLIEGNTDIKDLLDKFDYSNLSYDSAIFNEIIKKLNHEFLKGN